MGDRHWAGPCRVAPDGGAQEDGLACVLSLGSVRYVIFLRVPIVITTEHWVCVDIVSHSAPVTQSGTSFFPCKELDSK